MSAGRSASFCLMIHFLLCSSEALENITTVVGQEFTLPCKVNNNNKTILAVKWSRTDLDPEYVLFYRGRKLMSDNQHPSYVNRVDLQDREMKDGDVSMILKNVKMNDTGTYECRVSQRETNLINTIYLVVGPSGDKDVGDKDGGDKDGGDKAGGHKDGGHKDGGGKVGGEMDGIIYVISLGVVVPILLLVALVAVVVCRGRLNKMKSDLPVPPDEAADKQML